VSASICDQENFSATSVVNIAFMSFHSSDSLQNFANSVIAVFLSSCRMMSCFGVAFSFEASGVLQSGSSVSSGIKKIVVSAYFKAIDKHLLSTLSPLSAAAHVTTVSSFDQSLYRKQNVKSFSL